MKQTTKSTKIQSLSAAESESLAGLFKALADPSRLSLFSVLAEGEACVHELAGHLDKEQSTVSHQLRTLRNQKLVVTRRQGRHIYYSLADSHVRDIFAFAVEHARHDSSAG